MRLTYTAVIVARALLAAPDVRHWGTALRASANMPPGTLYPILSRMLAAGWLKDHWENPADARRAHTGPPRRYYHITPQGRTGLADFVRRWDETRAATTGGKN